MPRPRHATVALATPALILVADVALRRQPPRLVAALLDEPAHVATALLLLGLLHPHATRPTAIAVALAAILLDADHAPLEFLDWPILNHGTGRPATHSLLAVTTCLALAAAAPPRRGVFAATAFGLAAHLLRDMATGGVPFFWPLTPTAVRYPYPAYAALLLSAAALLAGREFRPRAPGRRGTPAP